MNFAAEAKTLEPLLLELRHDFHQHPELPAQEFRTSQKVREWLTANGIELLPLDTPTSLAAIIRGGQSGPTAALRTELDALPIEEQGSLPFKSVNPGVMHACGHDVHLSCVLGAARLLQAHREELRGSVVLLFQAAEEISRGALEMIEAGVLDYGMEAVFGLHTNTSLDAGDVAFLPGAAQASADLFTIDIRGQGGHGAFPHTTVDPVMITGQLLVQLQSIVSRNLDPLATGVVSVCQLSAGTSPNIIPETAQLRGTIRALDSADRERIIQRMEAICRGMETSFGCQCRLLLSNGAPAVVNDGPLTAAAIGSCRKLLGEEHVKPLLPAMVGDDMAYFMQKLPCVLGALGVRNEALGIVAGNHTPQFMVDERCLVTGAACLAQMAWDFVNGSQA